MNISMKINNLSVKYFLFFFFLTGVFLVAIGSDNKSNIQIHLDSDSLFIQNGSISLKISDHLKLSPALLDKGQNLSFVSNIPHDMPTFYVRAEGEVINRFKVDWDTFREESINDGIGQGRRIEITAYANQNVSSLAEPVNLEMTLNLYLYEQFPFSVITQFKINNLGGQIIQIDKIVSNDYHLDRRLLDPAKPSWEFVSYQGTSLHWGKDYAMIRTTPDMKRENFLGITLIENGRSTGGGTPIIDIWAPQCGLALASVEPKPQWISMPMSGNHEGLIEIAIVEDLKNNPGKKNLLKPGESLSSIRTALILHKLDFYDPLSTFSKILRAQGVAIPEESPEQAYTPYWKSWGLGMDFTQDQIFESLDVLKQVGVFWANLDDGWFTWYGDWEPNPAPGKFPDGDKDMIAFVEKLHKKGFKTSLWWYPQGVSPESELAKKHPDWLVQNKDGSLPKDSRDLYYLCPVYGPCIDFVEKMTGKIINEWDYDGLYIDTDALNTTPPCFNKAHQHKTPLESFQDQALFYRVIYEKTQELKPGSPVELCACARPHDPYKMPYYNVSNTSDPTTIEQVRRRVKVEKALHGPTYCVGDCYQIPMNEWEGYSVPESFESAVGTGAQVTTFFTDLNDKQKEKWRRWVTKYNDLQLSGGQYLNLYDLAWDKPEGHVVRKDEKLYYGFFAPHWSRGSAITLRGLEADREYKIRDYANDVDLGLIHGNNPILKIAFKESLLLEVTPIKK